MASPAKSIRCAIYTRKSTEHGLELEFNSLDAQREACEAYIKSQASQGWRVLPDRYDDPAFSGGNLDRPALQRLLKEIEAGRIDVIVVYKIDRLTRSLADFAKLVEAFDAKSVSFVAVTQQFNTTSSMGRLTLNVLLSFAQFERELSSERVRDKVAASRRKGKWTGGTVPLGYDAVQKKLVINPVEAKTVRYIFKRYLELQSFSRLVADLDTNGIVTKRRDVTVAKYRGGIPFTYGPLAHVLKNRIYLGEVGHDGAWFPGEHQAIVDQPTFEKVQYLLAANRGRERRPRTESGSLLTGKLFDDRGNRMSPSYSTKNGIRYRFYVTSALLRGRKAQAGSVGRVSATEIDGAILKAVQTALGPQAEDFPHERLAAALKRAVLQRDQVEVSTGILSLDNDGEEIVTIQIPWSVKPANTARMVDTANSAAPPPDQALLQSIVRAHAWVRALAANDYASIEALAAENGLHPKNVRVYLRLAFLPPVLTSAILAGEQPVDLTLKALQNILPLSWAKQLAAVAHIPDQGYSSRDVR